MATIMDYETKYNDAFERAKAIYQGSYKLDTAATVAETLQNVFPELKESDDVRIRKEIISALKWVNHKGVYNKHIAWLEKQGEKKITDKSEPKFKVGDWCIDNEDGTIFQIVKLLDNTYSYKTDEGKEYSCTHYSLENDAHLWTIQDAKDGDVLACNEEIILFKSYSVQGCISLYCRYNGQTNNFHSKELNVKSLTTRNKICPATKEQCDLLFCKMKEDGYEWNDKEKKLKKIEQKHIEWSEEDEENLQGILDEIEANKSSAPDYDLETYDRFLSWLKSLKQRIGE